MGTTKINNQRPCLAGLPVHDNKEEINERVLQLFSFKNKWTLILFCIQQILICKIIKTKMFYLIFLVRLYEFEAIHRLNSIVNIFDRIF